jgi:CHAT domain-containing protein/tetratricopeptide (TPR) repeat protein
VRIPLLTPGLLATIIALSAPTSPAQDRVRVTLAPGPAVERHLGDGEEHQFAVPLAAGEYVRIGVEQRGIDVRATIRDGDGTLIEDAVDGVGPAGEESVEIVATVASTYTLAVAPAEGAESGDYAVRMDAPRPATADERRMQKARSLRTEARQVEQIGHYPEARGLLEQALEIAQAVRGDGDTVVGVLLFELAGNALETLDDERSRVLYERAVSILDRQWGPAHPYPAMARSRLALLEERAGQRQKAETEIRTALPLLERSVGVDHPWYLLSLVTLGNLRAGAGDLQEGEAIERRALAAVERSGQTGTLLEATVVNSLADILRATGDYAAAETLFVRSMAIGESVLQGDSLFVATALQNLGIMARERKNYPAAIADYLEALAIRERLLGPDHPTLAGVLTNLANVYRATGDDRKALETHFRALRLWEASFGPNAREALLVVGNIARTYAGMGDIENALAYQRRADAILESQMGLYLAMGSERQKLTFLRSESERTDRTLSLHLSQAPQNPRAATLAALVLLQRKGRVEDVMTDVFGAVRQRVANPADRAILDQLRDTTAELARLAIGGPAATGPHASIAELEARRERLEATLSDRSAEFRAELRPVTLEHVQASIPGDAMLLEFSVFRPFDRAAERNEDAYGPPHYAAYLIAQHGSPIGADLGTVNDIDRLVARLRDALRDPASTDVKARARALDERIMQPLRGSLHGATRLLVSPDGGLNLVPFETLVDERGRYLIERYATSYVTSGRDLLRMGAERGAAGRPVIVADPLFGEPATTATRPSRTATDDARRSVTAAPDMATLYFAPLSGSAIEAKAIKSLFPDATLLTGRHASKAALEEIAAPSILHIASHGFFLADKGDATTPGLARNPLLRSGLALAGANLPDGARGDGILTALEAAGLDLWGTHLVTLSACDTGLGEVRNGEGVYGLRRAFMLAGAESLVMSLWPVSDSIARDTMVAYYVRLRAGSGRGDALRQAKLAILRRPGLRHPYYWAGFIQSGDWTRLRAR